MSAPSAATRLSVNSPFVGGEGRAVGKRHVGRDRALRGRNIGTRNTEGEAAFDGNRLVGGAVFKDHKFAAFGRTDERERLVVINGNGRAVLHDKGLAAHGLVDRDRAVGTGSRRADVRVGVRYCRKQ